MPDDVHPHAVGRVDPARGRAWKLVDDDDDAARDHPVGDGALRTVDVGEERLERAHALRDARAPRAPTRRPPSTRGTTSSGKGRSSPAKSNVTPWAR